MSEQAANEDTKLVENATCTFCGCVCDDMMLTVDMKEKRITKAKNACVLGRAWFAEHYIEEDAPPALIDGKPATVEDAVEEAAQTLVKARFPHHLRPQRHHLRGPAAGRRHCGPAPRLHRHHHFRLPWAYRPGVPGRGRKHHDLGRGEKPRRSGHLLGRQPGRVPSPGTLAATRSRPRACSPPKARKTAPWWWWMCAEPPAPPPPTSSSR